ncbi:peptidoglycan synthetase ftsI precursor [Dinoroseobacter shibae DFL 12 = DSM 16493]|jgi:cell division protein FtsI (penicillin-binding protein 3)|uniref:Peptidoglycan synthetase ftsI n=1 Tax=Dinoroseobacter shibae (strain DSM 16493 / NCIMB 14021 / DFL 12) TaxID=398580 RepID=A8LSB3_DINSH|nr:penicillin-binding protein 2 [Dinoroseobacter shibae]ABV94206.1 peptidoglycan synthetase ftsI precursor [Dinoroseobacter shibae DFL 12 = DSM 16493]URF45648.1 penicillin-binding protein 2 [Dinoroseobacter shibae]URF49953.1 penicillin-binding protein 2 [Dinoroseobacter shibae]
MSNRLRTPLRPLARILHARQTGGNPDLIERENIRRRHEALRDDWRVMAEQRLLLAACVCLLVFGLVGVRMWAIASEPVAEPVAAVSDARIDAARADIVDREGRVLATNLVSHSLYAQPPLMTEPERSAAELARIFPDLDEARMRDWFTGERKFLWLKRRISPEQMQAVHDIGDPGLQFGPREMRLYPNGALAAHILGGTGFGREGVQSAELIGVAGVEKAFNARLSDPATASTPLALSIDLTVQAVVEDVLASGMRLMNAKGAAAVLMDVHTGEIIAKASLPDFDPNSRPRPLTQGDQGDSPLFNRAVQGVYELGSSFKIFTTAQALELGLVSPETMLDTTSPMTWGRFRIRDFRNYGPELSVTDVIVKSSNVGTARLALQIGGARQKDFLEQLGFLAPTPVEMIEAPGAVPLWPSNWSDIHTMTISYGHGISTSPLHLAAGYASLLNGGTKVTPTLLRQDAPVKGPRVVSERTSRISREMLHAVVERGTASFGRIEGYAIGGKTGTADKPRAAGGGYYDDKVIATFASVFPADDPEYVLVVTLDEPVETSGEEPRRTAGWTAVPVSAEITRRILPLLGLRPTVEYLGDPEITLVSD